VSLEDWFVARLPTMTQKDIAAELGVDDSTVSRYIQRLGLEPRPTGRPSEAVA
jgi:transcriptional regulator with XRE-family HTH domain